jgi:hypothetical protein
VGSSFRQAASFLSANWANDTSVGSSRRAELALPRFRQRVTARLAVLSRLASCALHDAVISKT